MIEKKNYFEMEKEQLIKFRVSGEDKLLIKQRAGESQMSVSEYCRKMSIQGKIIVISNEEKIVIRGIANNFNQLMMKYHATGYRPSSLETELRNLLKELQDAYR